MVDDSYEERKRKRQERIKRALEALEEPLSPSKQVEEPTPKRISPPDPLEGIDARARLPDFITFEDDAPTRVLGNNDETTAPSGPRSDAFGDFSDFDDYFEIREEPSNWKPRLTLMAVSAAVTAALLWGYTHFTEEPTPPPTYVVAKDTPKGDVLEATLNGTVGKKPAKPLEEEVTITFESDKLWDDKKETKQKEVVKKKNPTKLDFQKVMKQGKCYRTRGSYYFAFSKPHKGFAKGRQYKLSPLSLMWVVKKSVDPKARYEIPCSGLVTRLPLIDVQFKGQCYQITYDGGRERDTFMFREGISPLDKGFRPRQHYRVDHKARVLHTIYREGVLETVQKVECTKLLQKAQ